MHLLGCGGCKARGLEEDCSYKPSDMPPPMYGHIAILRQTVLTVKQ